MGFLFIIISLFFYGETSLSFPRGIRKQLSVHCFILVLVFRCFIGLQL